MLKEQLEKKSEDMRNNIPKEALDVITKTAQKLLDSQITKKALKIGDKIPNFELKNSKNETFKYNGKGTIILNFIRGSWCPYCNLEVSAWQKVYDKLKAKGAEMIMLSPNLINKVSEMEIEHNIKFKILSDQGNKLAKQFGLVYTLAEELRPIYKQFGFNIPEDNGDNTYELPMPATYLIKDGIIIYSFVNSDYTKRAEPSEVIKLI